MFEERAKFVAGAILGFAAGQEEIWSMFQAVSVRTMQRGPVSKPYRVAGLRMKRLMKRIAHLAFLLGLIGLPASLVAGDTTSTTRHATHHARSHVMESASAQ